MDPNVGVGSFGHNVGYIKFVHGLHQFHFGRVWVVHVANGPYYPSGTWGLPSEFQKFLY